MDSEKQRMVVMIMVVMKKNMMNRHLEKMQLQLKEET